MQPDYEKSIRLQIETHKSRTSDERLRALADLLDTARALAPKTSEARERRRLLAQQRQQERERLREFQRRLAATSGTNTSPGD